ncbi:MAG: ATP-binding protein [Chlorobiaceae bacterium]
MISIRQKLVLGFSGLLMIIVAMGVMTIKQIDSLGGAIDVILKQNYRSVVACQNMTEALERIDSGVLFTFSGHYNEGMNNIREHELNFDKALRVELGNITLSGEGEKAQQIKSLFSEYIIVIKKVTDSSLSLSERQHTYFSTLLPLFRSIKHLSGQVLEMNQSNMNEANNNARDMAASAHNTMLAAIFASAVVSVLFSYLSHRWILMPIKKLIVSTDEIRKGNLDLVLDTNSTDEIGQLSESFNEMAVTLRKMRNSDKETLLRTRRVTQEVFKVLPSPIAVLDLNGNVEVSTEAADHYFGMKPGVNVHELGYEWLKVLLQKAFREGSAAEYGKPNGFVQHFSGTQEYFFQPMAVPVPAGRGNDEFVGTALILKDVTQLHEQLELKCNVISTVSHQLRTPLTSLRMSIHLLLEERVGQLNEKQEDLLVAAREETERLVNILDDLLDIHRIESGKANLHISPVSPFRISIEGIEPFLVTSRDKGVSIENTTPEGLPEILADPDSLRHVFANLLSNALRFTSPGGSVTISATENQEGIRFSVADTGTGISPEHVEHLFEQFYRVPGQDDKSGIGLGLSIVKEIIEAHGGQVGAESDSGKGTVFWFTIPMKMQT